MNDKTGTDAPRCGSTDTVDGEPCGRPVDGPDVRCYLHDEAAERPDEHGAPDGNPYGGAKPGNTNAVAHGLYSDPSKLYHRLDDWERDLIDDWKSDLRDDLRRHRGVSELPSYFGPLIHRFAVNCFKITYLLERWQAGDHLPDDVEHQLVDRYWISTDAETGRPEYDYVESTAELAASRLSRENERLLSDAMLAGDAPTETREDDRPTSLAEAAAEVAGDDPAGNPGRGGYGPSDRL